MRRLGLVVGVLCVALIASLMVRVAIVELEDPVVVTHWSNSHPLREGLLLDMADRFNDERHETASGQPIEVRVVKCDSSVQVEDLVARVTRETGVHECKDDGERADNPTIVTPQSDDWLVDINHGAEREVIDRDSTKAIADAYLGIVTQRDMAECLKDTKGPAIGYEDILELATTTWDSAEYAGCRDGRGPNPSWGTEPRLAFTNPSTSTSGRNALVTLYATATGIHPSDLKMSDVTGSDVVDKVAQFQTAVDHYLPGTIELNTKIAQGDAGQFFLMPEDNLVSLVKGNEDARVNGVVQHMDPVEDLVMIYPEEGSVLNSNPAGVVDARWVSEEETAAATTWIDHLRDEEQQEAFMAAGFRPPEDLGLAVDEGRYAEWGLEAPRPATVIDPGKVDPAVLEAIVESWRDVKKPSIVTFVVDLSGSMTNGDPEPLGEVKDGLGRIIDEMAEDAAASSQIGLVTFYSEDDGTVHVDARRPGPLDEVDAEIGEVVKGLSAKGGTPLYDAVMEAIRVTDDAVEAPGTTPVRAVVVLSDGEATTGRCLDEVVNMKDGEADIAEYCAQMTDDEDLAKAFDAQGEVAPEKVTGVGLAMDDLEHPDTKVFFLGFNAADLAVGRILAEATDGEYLGSTDEDLAAVIEALSGYF